MIPGKGGRKAMMGRGPKKVTTRRSIITNKKFDSR